MANYSAESGGKTSTGAALTKRTGTASAAQVAAGSTLMIHNTGAGTHVVTINNTGTYNGLSVGDRSRSVSAGQGAMIYVDPFYDGNADGFVPISIDGTASEVIYYVLAI
jgi:hypothetical protein